MLKEGDRLVTGHRLIRFLGRGNFGEVWQATAPGNTYAALKFVNLEQSHGRKEYRSIQPLKHLRHANLLQMTAIWLLDEKGEIIPDEVVMQGVPLFLDTVRGTLATVPVLPDKHRACTLIIAMPFADKSVDHLLKEYIEKGQPGIPRDELFAYMVDAAKAIDFLNSPHHDLGQGPVAIRHCDVKPENLLLMGQSVVLCDFGVARTMGSAGTRKTAMGGSLAYMAPECLADDVTPFSDQFSLAISYLELRTGKLPFEDESPVALMEQRRRGTLDLSSLPASEAAVIRRATSVQPDRRYPSALAMVEALQTAVAPRRGGQMPVKLIIGALVVMIICMAIASWPGLIRHADHAQDRGQNDRLAAPLPWEEPETAAHALITQPNLSDSQFQEAVDKLTVAVEQGLPDERLVFPHPLGPSLELRLKPDEIAFEPAFNPFGFSQQHGIGAVQRTEDGLTAVLYQPGDSTTDPIKTLVPEYRVERVANIGWWNGHLLIFAQKANRQFVTSLSPPSEAASSQLAPSEAMKTLFENADNSLIDIGLSSSGQRAVVVEWDAKQMTVLNDSSAVWKLPDFDVDDDPLLKLSSDGTWAAILTSHAVHVVNIASEPQLFTKMDLGESRSGVDRRTFSIEVDDAYGWITTDTGLDNARTVLMRFDLAKPSQFDFIELPQLPSHSTWASLHKHGTAISLLVGYDTALIRSYVSVREPNTYQDSVDSLEAAHDHEVVAAALGGGLSPDGDWAVFATRDGRIYLQRLVDGSPAWAITRSESGVPRQLELTPNEIIVGFEKGTIEVFDWHHCRMIYEAAQRGNKIPRPSANISVIKS